MAGRYMVAHIPVPDYYSRNSQAHLAQVFDYNEKNGAAYVTRTRDPVITNDVLYQLS